jgi:hypothetical protein
MRDTVKSSVFLQMNYPTLPLRHGKVNDQFFHCHDLTLADTLKTFLVIATLPPDKGICPRKTEIVDLMQTEIRISYRHHFQLCFTEEFEIPH